jgi:hypothetical protein
MVADRDHRGVSLLARALPFDSAGCRCGTRKG